MQRYWGKYQQTENVFLIELTGFYHMFQSDRNSRPYSDFTYMDQYMYS
jgi:hypothetical protein